LKQGQCPKCHSQEVYAGVDVLPKSGPFGSNSIPISIVSIAALDNYVCVQCGYLERYVADPENYRYNDMVRLTRLRSNELRRGSPCLSSLQQAAGYSGEGE